MRAEKRIRRLCFNPAIVASRGVIPDGPPPPPRRVPLRFKTSPPIAFTLFKEVTCGLGRPLGVFQDGVSEIIVPYVVHAGRGAEVVAVTDVRYGHCTPQREDILVAGGRKPRPLRKLKAGRGERGSTE